MTESVIIGVISLIGTLSGTFGGILISNKLSNYRISKLEEEVKKHNNIIERVYNLEKRSEINEEKLRVANHRIQDLEKYI